MADVIPTEIQRLTRGFCTLCYDICLEGLRTVFPKHSVNEEFEKEVARLAEILEKKYLNSGTIPKNA